MTECAFQKMDEARRLVGGIVYKADTKDADGDWAEPADVWEGVESFALNGFTIKKEHRGSPVRAVVVESFQAEADTVKGGKPLPAGGWWLTLKILDDALWKLVLSGDDFSGFSMGGRCQVSQEGD